MARNVLVYVFHVEIELIAENVLRSLSFAQEKLLRHVRLDCGSTRSNHAQVRPRLYGVEFLLDVLQLAVADGVSGENIEALLKVELEWVRKVVVVDMVLL